MSHSKKSMRNGELCGSQLWKMQRAVGHAVYDAMRVEVGKRKNSLMVRGQVSFWGRCLGRPGHMANSRVDSTWM
jgi:hypothetical protein